MKYISASDASKRWGITVRRVQKLCAEERIEGAIFEFGMWKIPFDAQKPKRLSKDISLQKKEKEDAKDSFEYDRIVPHYRLGDAKNEYERRGDDLDGLIYKMQYHSYRGEPEQALEFIKKIQLYPDMENSFLLNIFMLEIYIDLGNREGIFNSAERLGFLSANDDASDNDWWLKTIIGLYHNYYREILDRSFHYEDMENYDILGLPEKYRSHICYVLALENYICGNDGVAVGIVETALAFTSVYEQPFQKMLLEIIASLVHMRIGNINMAKRHFMHAWSMIIADEFYGLLAKYREILGGIEEICIRRNYLSEYKKYTNVVEKNDKNYLNLAPGDSVLRAIVTLSPIEHAVTMLASSQKSNEEISQMLDISVNTVRAHMRSIFSKIGIKQRDELIDIFKTSHAIEM